jgi:streptogramin lyase
MTDGFVWLAVFGAGNEGALSAPSGPPEWTIDDLHVFSRDEIMQMPKASGGRFDDAEIAPDGTLWIALERKIGRYSPPNKEWQSYDLPDDRYPEAEVDDLAVAPDGSVWIVSGSSQRHSLVFHLIPASDDRAGAWRTYDARDGVPDPGTNCVTVAPDGTVWLGSDAAVARCTLIE